jgi:hypothetical protein
MATLQDIQYSMNGEKLEKSKLGKDFAGLVTYRVDEKTGKAIYPTGKKFYLFKLVDNTKKGGVRLSNVDDVINPDTKMVERARLLSGVNSIWQKHQKDLPKDYEKQNWVELRFVRHQKMLRVADINKTALEFLRVSNGNIGNPFRAKGSRHEFFEYDSAIAEHEAFEKENFELEMAILAKEAKPEPMRKHAAFLGIAMVNAQTGEPKSDEGVRREYVMYAKRNPEYFQKTIKSPEIEIAWLVRKAIGEGMIDVGKEVGKVFWSRDGGYIGTYSQTDNPTSYLVNLALTNSDDGKKFKEQLQNYIK